MKVSSATEFEVLAREAARAQEALRQKVLVCCGTGCLAAGSAAVAEALRREVAAQGLDADVGLRLCEAGCRGLCELGPLVTFEPSGLFYHGVQPGDVPEIVAKTVSAGEPIPRLLYRDAASKKRVETYHDIPFYRR
ncbi:MAG: (2Fe-2S) ferredoxin domain-containing protein, partial [Deltaproteobacteria bacterium]|nr:(2Fe-2S) ferredoxin domain-containing protein [Deltaproteobacteria bacterium]